MSPPRRGWYNLQMVLCKQCLVTCGIWCVDLQGQSAAPGPVPVMAAVCGVVTNIVLNPIEVPRYLQVSSMYRSERLEREYEIS